MPFALGKRLVFVVRFICKLRGGSQPILAEASDGKIYVVKFADNLQGPQLLFNEVMGTELYRACGLPVAPWKRLWITDSFLDQNEACWFVREGERRRPASGPCFGSLFMGGDDPRTFDILPGSYHQRVRNAEAFWLAWLLDVCADHTDGRQAIFREAASRELDTIFVDFGHMFGGPAGTDRITNCRRPEYWDKRIYPRAKPEDLLTILKIVGSLDSDKLRGHLADVPFVWSSESAIERFSECLGRLSDARFVKKTLDHIKQNHLASNHELRPRCGEQPGFSVPHTGVLTQPRGGRAHLC